MEYLGNELDNFADVSNWKRYWSSFFSEIDGRGKICIEIGSGIGSNAPFISPHFRSYEGYEPDPKLVQKSLNQNFYFFQGDIKSIEQKVDGCICYIDVFEHIERDDVELVSAANHLQSGSYLFILVPAHNFLFSDFDRAIGHYRRYSKKTIQKILPTSLTVRKMCYLDSIGFFALLLGNALRRKQYPTSLQIKIWDRLVPISEILDKVTRHHLGKSLLVILERV